MQMKSAMRVAIVAGTLLCTRGPTAEAQVTQSGVSGSVFLDLVKKGKNDLDNFDYTAATTVWNQLLVQSLSRQQRIDVLQLLAATLYPIDPENQKKDSASSVVRQLV